MPFSQVETSTIDDVQPKHGSECQVCQSVCRFVKLLFWQAFFYASNFLVLRHYEFTHLLGC